jgi:hypothetical protein
MCNTSKSYQYAAGRHADIATLATAHDLGMPYTYTVMAGAARCNQGAVVQFLRKQGCPCDSCTYQLAAGGGDTALCAYLHAEQCPWNALICDAAARNGHTSTLRWLREHGCPWHSDGVRQAAAQGGSIDVLMYLQQQGIVFTTAN